MYNQSINSVTMLEFIISQSRSFIKFLLFFQIILENFRLRDINIFTNNVSKFFINNKLIYYNILYK